MEKQHRQKELKHSLHALWFWLRLRSPILLFIRWKTLRIQKIEVWVSLLGSLMSLSQTQHDIWTPCCLESLCLSVCLYICTHVHMYVGVWLRDPMSNRHANVCWPISPRSGTKVLYTLQHFCNTQLAWRTCASWTDTQVCTYVLFTQDSFCLCTLEFLRHLFPLQLLHTC